MERYEVADDERLTAMVAAIERGDEVVLTRDGEPVAELHAPTDRKTGSLNASALTRLRQGAIALRVREGGALIRQLRDEAH